MTEREIVLGNKEIAIFMDLQYEEDSNLRPEKGYWDLDSILFAKNGYQVLENMNSQYLNSCEFDKLQYHSNWNWLLPVIQKLKEQPFLWDFHSTEFLDNLAKVLVTLDIQIIYEFTLSEVLKLTNKNQND